MNEITQAIVTIATGIIGVAIVATLVSKNANTSGVISSGGTAFSLGLQSALSPVTGNVPNLASSLSVGGLSNEFD